MCGLRYPRYRKGQGVVVAGLDEPERPLWERARLMGSNPRLMVSNPHTDELHERPMPTTKLDHAQDEVIDLTLDRTPDYDIIDLTQENN